MTQSKGAHYVHRSKYDFAKSLAGRWLTAGALCCLPLIAAAQSTDRISAAEFGRLWGPALAGSSATQVRNFPSGPSYPVTSSPVVAAESGGSISVTKTARFPISDGRVIDVVAKSPISKPAMGKALGAAVSLAGGPLGVALFLLPEIVDYLNSSGLRSSPSAPGTIEIVDPNICTVAPCFMWRYSVMGFYNTVMQPTAYLACSALVSQLNASGYYMRNPRVTTPSVPTTSTCTFDAYYASGVYYASPSGSVLLYTTRPVDPITYIPATPEQIESAGSTPTMKPEWLKPLLDAGVAVDAADATLTGPTTVTGPSTTSTQTIKDAQGNTTGTKTINTSNVTNITYNGNTYTTNNVSTVTTINPDGTSTVETKTEQQQSTQSTDCEKFPDSVGCKTLDVPTDQIPKVTKNVTYAAENLGFGSGSCIPDTVVSTSKGTYSVSWAPYCTNLTTYIKPVLIALALLTAFFIVAPIREG